MACSTQYCFFMSLKRCEVIMSAGYSMKKTIKSLKCNISLYFDQLKWEINLLEIESIFILI
jgi:hypothetical protein